MPRFRFRCEYLGSAFEGWQEQNQGGTTRAVTVQSELENALAVALRAPVKITGAGRTDSGVHARGQCVHFDWTGNPFDTRTLERSVNGLTRRTVRIRDLEPCSDSFHARYDALCRYYQYTQYLRPVALGREYGWECGRMALDPDLMAREATRFLGTHDFDDFSIPRHDGKSTECTLSEFRMERRGHELIWHIKGNRFLHRQVRSMVGMLFDVGRGRHPEGSTDAVFAKTFKGERTWAPPQGLVLENVEYADY